MKGIVDWNTVLASLIYAGLGIVILVVSFVIIEKLSPQNLWKEVSQNKNTALAMIARNSCISAWLLMGLRT